MEQEALAPDVHGIRVKDDTAVRIVNSDHGVTNFMDNAKFMPIIRNTFHEIASRLAEHCGPYSRYALVVTPSGGKYDTNTFTKDGRNIINAISFMSPIEEIFKNMILYIGTRVDNNAGDGTTSSMFIASRLFEFITIMFGDKKLNTREFANNYKMFHDTIMHELDNQKVTLDDLLSMVYEGKARNEITNEEFQNLVANIAAFQAMSSSGGDLDISKAIYEIYKKSPEGTWNNVNVYHNKLESSSRYAVQQNDSDYIVNRVNCEDVSSLNSNFGTEYHGVVDLLVLPEDIPDSGVLTDVILDYITSILEDKERTCPLVIICRGIGNNIAYRIQTHNNRSENFKVAVFTHPERMTASSFSLELAALSYASGMTPYMSGANFGVLNDAYLITNVDVTYANNQFKVSGIFDFIKRKFGLSDAQCNGVENPLYTNPDVFPEFNNFIKSMQEKIDTMTNNIYQDNYVALVEALVKIVETMSNPRRPYLMVGGNSHDHAAAVDVVRDVCGAVNASLQQGFVVGSSRALKRALLSLTNKLTANESNLSEGSSYMNKFSSAALLAVNELIAVTTFGETPDTIGYVKNLESFCEAADAVKRENMDNIATDKYMYVNLLENDGAAPLRSMINAIKEPFCETSSYTYPIIQPASVFEQVFERIGDLMIKLITTSAIVVPGGVFVDSDKSQSDK